MVESFERRLFDRNWSHYAVLLIVTYLALVRFLRYRRRDSTARKYGYLTRNSFSSMTLEDAFAIQLPLAEQEFPKVYSISVFFALFKVRKPFDPCESAANKIRLMEYRQSPAS